MTRPRGLGSSVIATTPTSCGGVLLSKLSVNFVTYLSMVWKQSVHRRRAMNNRGNASTKSHWFIGTLTLAVALWSFGVDGAAAQANDRCDGVLLTHNPTNLKARSVVRLATLRLVTRETYEQAKQQYKNALPDYFAGSFDGFNGMRLRELSSEAFDWSSDASRAVVTSSLPLRRSRHDAHAC